MRKLCSGLSVHSSHEGLAPFYTGKSKDKLLSSVFVILKVGCGNICFVFESDGLMVLLIFHQLRNNVLSQVQ